MASYNMMVKGIILKSDVVLELLDARFIEKTQNKKIEKFILEEGKILIHVINKCDFVDKGELEKIKKNFVNCVFVSAKNYSGLNLLREKIIVLAKQKKIKNPYVGVIGYPNVGKSSLINAIKGKSSAKTSSVGGQTRGQQYVKIRNSFLLIDSPGILSKKSGDDVELGIMGTKNPNTVKDPDFIVYKLLDEYPGRIEKKYGVTGDKNEILEKIAIKMNFKMKGNQPDIDKVSRRILSDWVKGKV